MCLQSNKRSAISIGTLNDRGVKHENQRKSVGRDMKKYGVQIIGIQETHIAAW